MSSHFRPRGFTLVELLVTVAIIGILTGMASVAYSMVNQRGRDAQRVSDLNQVKISLSAYYSAQASPVYVTSASPITINGTNDALTVALSPNYIRTMPVDPINSGNNVYKYSSQNSARNFTLTATFENKQNRKGWTSGAWAVDGYKVYDS